MSAAPHPVAIVTGAERGIGAGLAAAFRRRGYAVVATSRSIPASDDSDLLTVQGDIADADTSRHVVDQALERFGRIDSLINNAGVYIGKPFTDYTSDDFAAITAVNLAGFFHITQHAIPPMLSQSGGQGRVGRGDSIVGDRVRRSGRACQRGLARGDQDPDARPASYEGMGTVHPLGRVGEIRDVVDGILYLEPASFVTGEILHIDGGQSAGN